MLWEISKGSRVKCFGKFPKREGLNRLRKFTGQGTCSHIHSELFLGNLRCFWDSVAHWEVPQICIESAVRITFVACKTLASYCTLGCFDLHLVNGLEFIYAPRHLDQGQPKCS